MNTQTLHLLHQTIQHFRDHNRQAYLTGGSLRNLLLGEPCNDWDIVTDGNTPLLARSLAELHGRIGHFPTLIRLRPKPGPVTTYEVAELLNLQTIRETARRRR